MSDQVKYRKEKDSMGEMQVPEWALWGASTQRAVFNFPVSGKGVPSEVVKAFGLLKAACARVNADLGKLGADKAALIIEVAAALSSPSARRIFISNRTIRTPFTASPFAETLPMLSDLARKKTEGAVTAMAKVLRAIGLTPNVVTLIGCFFMFVIGYIISQGYLATGKKLGE